MSKATSQKTHALKSARRFIRAVQKCGIRLQAAYLYGSYALDTAHADSDIDIALVSKDFTGRHSDWQKISPALRSTDAHIEHVRYRPMNFCDENPLVWEIKTTGIQLVGKPSRKARRPLQVYMVVKFWRKSADDHWRSAQTFLAVKRYPYALQFGRRYVEELLKAVIVRRTRAHAPFRLTLAEYADKAGLKLTPRQLAFLNHIDVYEPRNSEDELAFHKKYARRFCKSKLVDIRKFGKWLAAPPKSKPRKRT